MCTNDSMNCKRLVSPVSQPGVASRDSNSADGAHPPLTTSSNTLQSAVWNLETGFGIPGPGDWMALRIPVTFWPLRPLPIFHWPLFYWPFLKAVLNVLKAVWNNRQPSNNHWDNLHPRGSQSTHATRSYGNNCFCLSTIRNVLWNSLIKTLWVRTDHVNYCAI